LDTIVQVAAYHDGKLVVASSWRGDSLDDVTGEKR
jgi:hypothetical protein